MTESERFSLASHLYVRLRRTGRVIDAVHMSRDDRYAREILASALQSSDPDVKRLAERFEALLEHAAPAGVRAPSPVVAAAAPVEEGEAPAPKVSTRYVGSLR